MNIWLVALAGGLTLVLLALFGARIVAVFLKLRGTRVITCPETREPAAVALDASRAALGSVTGHKADWRLDRCSRWPERRDCGQECLSQIEAAPDGCLVRTMLAQWYAGKLCVRCGRDLGDIHHLERHPGFVAADGTSSEWREVSPTAIPEILQTRQPICWNCHVAAQFRRDFAELVTDRSAIHRPSSPALHSSTPADEKRNGAGPPPNR